VHDTTVKLFDFLDALPDAVVLVDGKGRIAHVNAGVKRLLGYEPEHLVGHPLSAVIPPRFRERHGELMKGFLANGKATEMSERPLLFALARGGAEVPVTVSLAPMVLGEVHCTVALLGTRRGSSSSWAR
jgi:PAS domain S-box-containing protein